jgi:cytoplasmic iron level regulating protein YaaA (DUF328/UPF0246 family)
MDKYKNILVPCTSIKSDAKGVKSDLISLSFHEELYQQRKQIIDLYTHADCIICGRNFIKEESTAPKRNLDWENCLPACQRYTGVIYSHVEAQNWQKADNVLIVSPLWGIIRPQDKIPNYSLEMCDFLIDKKNNIHTRIWKLWRPALDNLINKLTKNQKPYTLLYKKCSLGFEVNTRNTFESPITNWNDNYGHNKGRWLNNYLSNK